MTVSNTTPTTATPHKSTTHDERFYHVNATLGSGQMHLLAPKRATVFFRKENDGTVHASLALCHDNDQFNRRVGRSVSRRKYFQGKRRKVEEMSYEVAEKMVLDDPRW